MLADLTIYPPTSSDHGLVVLLIPFYHDTSTYAVIQVRGWRSLDREVFRAALITVPLIADPSTLTGLPVSEIFAIYETAVVNLVDDLLPSDQARVRRFPLSPWFDADCRSLRPRSRRLGRHYGITKPSADRSAWVQ